MPEGMASRRRNTILPLIVVLVVLGLGTAAGLYFTKDSGKKDSSFTKYTPEPIFARNAFALTPTDADGFGLETTTAFRLTSTSPTTSDFVTSKLAIAPDVQFDVEQESDTAFLITPKAELNTDTVYTLSLAADIPASDTAEGETADTETHRFQWAYNTKTGLKITGTLPRDKARSVPVDTGIEITFNTTAVTDVSSYVSISPETPGRFEQHGQVTAFVPDERLATGTLYTVTVRSGVPVVNSDVTLAANYVFKFETEAEYINSNEPFAYVELDRSFTATRPDIAPVVRITSYGSGLPNGVSASVYRFRDADDLIDQYAPYDQLPLWTYFSRRNFRLATDELTKVGTYELELQGDAFLFPDGFPEGYYLLELTLGSRTLQTPLVVSNVAATSFVTQTETVLWVRDLSNGQAPNNATVRILADGTTSETDAEGVARFTTPEILTGVWDDLITRSYFRITTTDGKETILPAVSEGNYGWWGYSGNRSFWSYLSTDRTLYRTTDTVNMWGILQQRYDDTSPVDVRMTISTWDLVDGNGTPIILSETTTSTTPGYGTFTAELPIEQFRTGYYTITAYVGDESVATRDVEVRTFTKPAYRIVATPNKRMLFRGEDITYAIQTEFFDGTPAPFIELAHARWGSAGAEGDRFTTDAAGQASITLTPTLDGEWEQNYGTFFSQTFFPAKEAEGDIVTETSVFVFPSLYTFLPEATYADGRLAYQTTVREVTEQSAGYSWWERTTEGDPVPNVTVTGTIYERILERTKTGTRYDFIEKRVVDIYTYSTREERVKEFSTKTNAEGSIGGSEQLEGDSFRVELATTDPSGNRIVRSAYAFSDSSYYSNAIEHYGVVDERALAENQYTEPYRIGETTNILFLKDGQRFTEDGPFLFVKLQNGIRDVIHSDTAHIPVTFTEDDMPNVFYSAAWFNGEGFEAPALYSLASLTYDETERELTVEATTDKEQYAPGETVDVSLNVTNPGGEPVQARVNVFAIDEALVAIQYDTHTSPLSGLYAGVGSGLLDLYVSHRPTSSDSGAEGGGGGGGPRVDFKDAALFTEVETSASGTARVSFKAPDNITSWKLTAQGVTRDRYAGTTSISIPVTKDVFGILTSADSFLTTDQPTIIARAYGTSLSTDDRVHMRFVSTTLGMDEQADAGAFEAASFALPDLTEGEYELRLTVTAGDSEDTLVRRITVLPSRLLREATWFVPAVPDATLADTGDGRATVTLSDLGKGRALSVLGAVRYPWGNRLDRHLAARIATDALATFAIPRDTPDSSVSLLEFQQRDGGISLISYGTSDLPLSAFAAARDDLFDRAALERYFTGKPNNKETSRDETAYALLGLAQLGVNVFPDLAHFRALEDVTPEQLLLAALAYYALGDHTTAESMAVALLGAYGEQQDTFLRLNIGASDDPIIVNTARFGILAEGLALPERFAIGRYLADVFPNDTITNLERALGAAEALALPAPDQVTITYRIGETEETATLTPGTPQAVRSLSAAERSAFTVMNTNGDVGITVLGRRPLNITETPGSDGLRLTREYSSATNPGEPITRGDLVRIELQPSTFTNILEDQFFIIDELPSGFVPVTQPRLYGYGGMDDEKFAYPLEVDGQRLVFWSLGKKAMVYYARAMMPGGYTAEPAIIQGQKNRDILNYTGASTLEIR